MAISHNGVVSIHDAKDAGVPPVEVRKLAARGALRRHGYGVYSHEGVPTTPETQPTIAVSLGGRGAFLLRESVLELCGLGHLNPRKIRVGSRRRVRRKIEPWMALEHVVDIADSDLTTYRGVPSTTVNRALLDIKDRIPRERWIRMVDEAKQRYLLQPEQAQMLVEL